MKRSHVHIIRATAIAVALAFILLGAMQGDHSIVLRKAMRICLECIGVG